MKRIYRVLAWTAIALLATSNAAAFSTAPHFDVTSRGLQKSGFSASAIDYVKISNQQVDYVVNYPTGAEMGDNDTATIQAAYFHFDDLPNPEFVRRSFVWIEKVAKASVAADNNDPKKILATLGIILHATQDFYGHSNFSDVDWQKLVGRPLVIYEELSDDLRLNPALLPAKGPAQPAFGLRSGEASGWHDNHGFKRLAGRDDVTPRCEESNPVPGCWPQHGGSSKGGKSFKHCDGDEPSATCHLNRDWHMRRGHFLAMQMAAESTHYWAQRFRTWIHNEDVWSNVLTFSDEKVVSGCMYRAQILNRLVGQWGRLGTPQKGSVFWDIAKEVCDGDWETKTWRPIFLSMHDVSADVVDVPMPSRGTYTGGYGTFNTRFGTKNVTFTVEKSGPGLKVSLNIDGGPKNVSVSHVDGPGFDFTIGKEWSGRLYGMNHSKESIAGYLRDSSGKTNGFYGTLKK